MDRIMKVDNLNNYLEWLALNFECNLIPPQTKIVCGIFWQISVVSWQLFIIIFSDEVVKMVWISFRSAAAAIVVDSSDTQWQNWGLSIYIVNVKNNNVRTEWLWNFVNTTDFAS